MDQRDQRGIVPWTTFNVSRFSSTLSGCDLGSAQLREKMAKHSSSVSSVENTSSLSVEVSVRLPNMDTLLDCDSSTTYSGFGDPILRIRFVVHRYGVTTTGTHGLLIAMQAETLWKSLPHGE